MSSGSRSRVAVSGEHVVGREVGVEEVGEIDGAHRARRRVAAGQWEVEDQLVEAVAAA